MRKGSSVLLCFVIMASGLAGCVPAHVVTSLKSEVSQLQIQYRELQQNHADLYAKVDSSLTNLGALNALVQDLQDKVSILNQAPHDLVNDLDKKVQKVEKVNKIEKVQKAERVNKVEKVQKVEKIRKVGRVKKTGKVSNGRK
ncbi:hypothetical protein AGMMS49990_09550 [Endomicrobiia bacterium]|nr:hypothetical protein AGMMS49990_09550 [Endomicrobiia bacterium]